MKPYSGEHTIFSSIPGFNGYLATINGDIISQRTNGGKINTTKFTKLNGELDKGYLLVRVRQTNGYRIKTGQHRLVALAFLPNKLEHVNHKDTNKLNNKLENLEWATASKNERHAWLNRCKSKVMDPSDILLIRQSSLSNKQLALNYNTTDRTIRDIRAYRTWKDIK